MSEIKVNSIKGTGASAAAITVNSSDGTCTANITNNLSNRNKIINGQQIISQRGTSETGINGANEGYRQAPDRWKVEGATFGAHTVSQSTESPNGFANSYKVDCTTAENSLSAGSHFDLVQKIEGQNLQNFAKGTSDAKQFALSFYVKTNRTGTYVVLLIDHDNSRMCAKTYTVSDTNWNRYTLNFPADTTGAFDNDNNASLSVKFVLVAGTTFQSGTLQTTWGSTSNANSRVGQLNFADSTSNEWYLTGVQLEVDQTGTGVATDFEHRSYGQELALCQRYYYVHAKGDNKVVGVSVGYQTNDIFLMIYPKVEMRTTPSFEQATGTNYYRAYNNGGQDMFDNWGSLWNTHERMIAINANSSGGLGIGGVGGQAQMIITSQSGASLAFSAEL